MYTFLGLFGIFLFCFLLERLVPRQELSSENGNFGINGWWTRAISFNLLQLIISLGGSHAWEQRLIGRKSVFDFGSRMSPFLGGLVAYVMVTWIFYWWHLFRHQNDFLWQNVHQLHHSPKRIEVLTSFYKHPLEIILNSFIIAFLSHPILGLSLGGVGWLTMWTGVGEFFYHVNITTPHWLGYFIQRPESHVLHHKRNRRNVKNHSDLPIWDMLNGTFENPINVQHVKTGFSANREGEVKKMLLGYDVLKQKRHPVDCYTVSIFCVLLLIGCMSTLGFILDIPELRGLAFATGASPFPVVFSVYNDVETFSLSWILELELNETGSIPFESVRIPLNSAIYQKLSGPYNRRNVFGAMLSYGPFFVEHKQIILRQQILHWAICSPAALLIDLGLPLKATRGTITVKSKTIGNENKHWTLNVEC